MNLVTLLQQKVSHTRGQLLGICNLATIFLLASMLTGCARQFILLPDTDFGAPFGRVLDAETFPQLPNYARAQEVCKRTHHSITRETEILEEKTALRNANKTLQTLINSAQKCETRRVSSCIRCTEEKMVVCKNHLNPFEWRSATSNHERLAVRLERLQKEHLSSYEACFQFVEKLSAAEQFELHQSALEPPKFLPVPIGNLKSEINNTVAVAK